MDTVVVSIGTVPAAELANELSARGFEVHVIGDADHPGQVIGAVEGGWKAGTTL